MENVTMYEPKHLKLWTMPQHYAGEVWPGYYVFLSQHRDSDSLTRSNFDCGLEAIGGESETVQVVREGHWAVGWVEWIAIHQDDEKALQIADEIKERLEDYPVVNEDHWSELEWNEAQDYWASMSIRERMELCERAGVSVFAARRDYIPQDDSGYIMESLRG
jgi:hypothetical protein